MQTSATWCASCVALPLPHSRLGRAALVKRRPQKRLTFRNSRQEWRPLKGFNISGPEPSGGGGSVDPEQAKMSLELMNSMKVKIMEELGAEKVEVSDVYGDGRHVGIDVVSSTFEGKSSVQRQRMVYQAIWLELQDAVHAVDAMTTKTPEEAAF